MQLYAFWLPAPMAFRITEPGNRLLEASHNLAEVIRQMCAGLLSDVVGQAVRASATAPAMQASVSAFPPRQTAVS
jgi:hypothetical protein